MMQHFSLYYLAEAMMGSARHGEGRLHASTFCNACSMCGPVLPWRCQVVQ